MTLWLTAYASLKTIGPQFGSAHSQSGISTSNFLSCDQRSSQILRSGSFDYLRTSLACCTCLSLKIQPSAVSLLALVSATTIRTLAQWAAFYFICPSAQQLHIQQTIFPTPFVRKAVVMLPLTNALIPLSTFVSRLCTYLWCQCSLILMLASTLLFDLAFLVASISTKTTIV